MKIEPFLSTRGVISYVLLLNGINIIIDPSFEMAEKIIIYLKKNNLKPDFVFETHTHADFFSSIDLIKKIYPDLQAFRGDFKNFEGIKGFEIIHTPGHTNNSHSFIAKDFDKTVIFTGDTLLIGGTGRTDFQGGSSVDLFESLTMILSKTSPETIVYPNHNYNGITSSTIKDELSNNQRLILVNKRKVEDFVNLMDNHTPPKPDLFEESIFYNSPLYKD